MQDNWTQFQILTTAENFELVSNALIINHVTGIETLANNEGLAVYLPASQLSVTWQQNLRKTLQDLGLNAADYHFNVLSNVDLHWGKNWAPFYKPVFISHFMSIIPRWQKKSLEGPYDIFMDPQEAFGSGEHATTKLCLQALELFVSQQKSLIDVGTGTGILAIAACKLGIRQLWGTDISSKAVAVAQENFQFNCPQAKFAVQTGSLLTDLSQKADIITANMLEEPIRQLIPQLNNHLNSKGLVIISGILAEHTLSIQELLQQEGFQILQSSFTQGWGCIVGQKEK
ncbi:50S ribosomal protein L11 methyltransferase [Bombilactobacillus bombi]|uniref:50S ribosomal protein L11 methyltransferase n=1 Tax=Bombilactobacillus bombi TaxID=1303590 RepID=UPI0015E60A17|nr:50S ribosomal protein L11 methyltransferase [Bombilactobacillus bombi]MBA1434615.1 50S ribosomal protein L11 methyltransferase [Bombilactobacillus bombi]